MRTGHEQYLSRRRPRARPLLRTARLNVVGSAALLGACLLAAVVGALALRATEWPLPMRAAVGPVAVVLTLLVADRRKWSRMETGFSFTDDVATLRAVADRLVEQGLPVTLDVDDGRARLRYRNRDAKRVRAALESLGIRSV